MRKNFDMDAAIRRALRESIEAHAHEWEPDFNTGVGPVGDDSPFDNKVSEECDKEEGCCPECGKCPCVCKKEEGDMNEGTIPGDSREWEPGFETGVGPVGDDNPFTQAVNESLLDTNDWESGSFSASNHRKEGISFADGGDECQNGVVATGQKNSGEVVSDDNLNEGEDEEDESTLGQFIKNGWNGLKNRWNQAREQDMANKGWVRAGATGDGGNGGYADNSGYQGNSGTGEQDVKTPTTDPSQKIIVGLLRAMAAAGQKDAAVNVLQKNKSLDAYWKYLNPKQPAKKQAAQTAQPAAPAQPAATEKPAAPAQPAAPEKPAAPAQPAATEKPAAPAKAAKTQPENGVTNTNNNNDSNIDPVTGKEAVYRESKEGKEDVIAEERDRFFNIINRIEKLYD